MASTARPGLAIRWRLTIWIAVAFALMLAAIFLSMRLAVGEILDNDIEEYILQPDAEGLKSFLRSTRQASTPHSIFAVMC